MNPTPMDCEVIPFLMAGYPDAASFFSLARAVLAQGTRTLEIGVPFSDPLADGDVIQRAAAQALKQRSNLRDVLAQVASLTSEFPHARIVLFTYLNPVYQLGFGAYAQLAKAAGVAATLAVDLPPEEALAYVRAHRAVDLGTVFLAAPTTSDERLRRLREMSQPFVYLVSRAGVTGARQDLSDSLAQDVQRVRALTGLPLAVGFGISTPEQAGQVSRLGVSVVIGSRLIALIAESATVAIGQARVLNFLRDAGRAVR